MITEYPFRTDREVYEIYKELATNGLSRKIYLFSCTADSGQKIVFCGVRHSNDSNDEQFLELKLLWDDYSSSDNRKKIVMCEGGVRPVHNLTKEQAILDYGDSGFASWLALNNQIELISPEPDTKHEVDALVREFGSKKVILYYFARQMHQWATMDFKTNPDWKIYADRTLQSNQIFFPDLKLDVENMLQIFEEELKEQFSWKNVELLYKISCPFEGSVSAASGKIRDKYIFENIEKYWNNGYDIFVVYGSGHAIVQEPALQKLTRR